MVNIFWFRRDLRLEDNTGLFHALSNGLPVLPLFIFDEEILGKLENKADARVTFIFDEISALKKRLEKTGSTLLIRYGNPAMVILQLIKNYRVLAVYTNHDYEPYAVKRDKEIEKLLTVNQISFKTFKDQVIFEKDEIVKDSGEPYTVFTPYSKKWKAEFFSKEISPFSSENLTKNFFRHDPAPAVTLESTGFIRETPVISSREIDATIIRDYHLTRDIPSIRGTTRLSLHLRFGTISIREVAKNAAELNETFLNELIWREFYMMFLWHFPRVVENSFKPQYDRIAWRNNEEEFEAWCRGTTGYAIVDAGMRELNGTGYMHNRLRMITASFLTKHLLIDWRWGEAYFAKKLLDYELASNNGGWQWAAGTGCDAAPYFRVFNPALQTIKFDPELKYIRKWVPEYGSANYPKPVVDHSEARNRALSAYKKALDKKI